MAERYRLVHADTGVVALEFGEQARQRATRRVMLEAQRLLVEIAQHPQFCLQRNRRRQVAVTEPQPRGSHAVPTRPAAHRGVAPLQEGGVGELEDGPGVSHRRPGQSLRPSSALRSANGLALADTGASSAASALTPVWSIWRECSLSWQYTHSSSQLLPSGGLSSW